MSVLLKFYDPFSADAKLLGSALQVVGFDSTRSKYLCELQIIFPDLSVALEEFLYVKRPCNTRYFYRGSVILNKINNITYEGFHSLE